MPQDLLHAIQHAQRVCDWMENLSKDEKPPSWMWPFEDELEIWFGEVDQKRKEKYGVKDDHDDGQPMMQNELAKGRGR